MPSRARGSAHGAAGLSYYSGLGPAEGVAPAIFVGPDPGDVTAPSKITLPSTKQNIFEKSADIQCGVNINPNLPNQTFE